IPSHAPKADATQANAKRDVHLKMDATPDRRRVQLPPDIGTRERAVLDHLHGRGASFFGPLHEAVGGGYPGETVDALWNLVWTGLVTNDTFHALRAFTRVRASRRRPKRHDAAPFRSRRLAPPSAEGRWTMVARDVARPV